MDAMTNDEDDDEVDRSLMATERPAVVDQIVFTVGDDILPRYYTQSQSDEPAAADEVVVVPYELYPAATGDWAQRVRDTSGVVVVCGAPVIVVVFSVAVLLTVGAIRRVQTSVLSTSFYVLVAVVVDAFVLWTQCGGEWLRAAVGIDLRDIITTSNAVLCKVLALSRAFTRKRCYYNSEVQDRSIHYYTYTYNFCDVNKPLLICIRLQFFHLVTKKVKALQATIPFPSNIPV